MALVVSVVSGGAVRAAMVTETTLLDLKPGQDFSLDLLITQDLLGDACIVEDNLDLAFHASGKGVRLPRTCLPEPCAQALTPFTLSSLIGRPAMPYEWDRYFARYADACRKEITSFEDEEEATSVSEEDFKTAFWAPIISPSVVPSILPRSTSSSSVLPRRPEFRIYGGGGNFPEIYKKPLDKTPPTFIPSSPNPEGEIPFGPTIAPVPLPLSGVALMSALVALIGFGRLNPRAKR